MEIQPRAQKTYMMAPMGERVSAALGVSRIRKLAGVEDGMD
jgi:hypothetical protein